VFWVLIGPERKTIIPKQTSAQRDKKQEHQPHGNNLSPMVTTSTQYEGHRTEQ
jgi:hypothetical protein